MPLVVALTLAAWLGCMLERRRRRTGGLDLDAVVLVGATWLASVGMATTLLAMLGRFDAVTTSAVAGIAAAIAWPWGRDRPPRRERASFGASAWRRLAAPLGVLVVGLLLRWPASDYPLAGRDQGTYTLRAQHTLRTGELHATDPVLAAAGREAGQRSGPADLQGLFARRDEPWRRDRYEAAYRPGFYLADLDTGRVQPQFFHLCPMLMATAGLVLGHERVAGVVLLQAALTLLGAFAVARRLWPRGPWALLAAGLLAVHPLAIWLQRATLSEGPAAVMVTAGVLAVLRARDGDADALPTAAFLLGSLAWIRGNGWLAVPVLLAAQWLVPRSEPAARRASLVYAATFGAAVLVHAPTTFPYLHDELLRQLPLGQAPTPARIVWIVAGGLAAWLVIGELGPRWRGWARMTAWIVRVGPWGLGLGLLAGVGAYVVLRPGDPPAPPWSRLDPVMPLVGAPALVLATLGLRRVLRAWPRTPSAVGAWLLGLGGIVVVTVGLYAQRNLPQLGLYYYGRYLVPELLPAILLLAVEGLRGVHAWVARPRGLRRGLALGLGAIGAAGLAWSTAGVLVLHPVTRMQEFAGAGRVVDHLAARLPAGAVVIAGGEGWHHGHTWNQVGGALAFRHGIAVLPYATREAAYASLYELLVGRPAATGEPAPPVFLLVNEATKHYVRRPDDGPPEQPVAVIDDLLPPPFVARRIELVEMLLDRLTPTSDGPPTRVTRDGLRMALLRIEVDPARALEVETWRLDAGAGAGDGAWRIEGPPGLQLAGGASQPGAPCLGDAPLVITLPEDGAAGRGPVSLVLVSTPGTASLTPKWRVELDGVPVVLDPPKLPPRARDTLGPIALPERPRTLVVRGAELEMADARCPRGGLVELRLLGPEAPMLTDAAALGPEGDHDFSVGVSAVTFAPPQTLGHPTRPVAWVSGRGLSRYRRGLPPDVELRGLSLVLEPGRPLHLPSAALPEGGRVALDLVVTLTGAAVGPEARLWISVDDQPLLPIDPPDAREGSWQSPAFRWQPTAAAAAFTLELRDARPGEQVLLRDIGLFSRAAPVPGRLALE